MGRRRRRVVQVRLDAGPTGTQAEIWMAGAGGFTTLNLSDPARLVVDLPASSAVRVVDAGGDRPRQVGADRPSGTGNLAHRVRSGAPVMAPKPRMEQGPGKPPADRVARRRPCRHRCRGQGRRACAGS
jgi:N-acetylmuramoyl-L-alanine amidase